MSHLDRSKSIENQLNDIQASLAEIEEIVECSSCSSVSGKSTTVERGDSASSECDWENEKIDSWCKKVDELISNYTTRPSRLAKQKLRNERKISSKKKTSMKKLRRKKLREKRRKKSRTKSSSLEKTDKRLKSIERMLQSLSKSPSVTSSSHRRIVQKSVRKSRSRTSTKKSNSTSSRSSVSLEARMDNIQTLLNYARNSSTRSISEEQSPKMSQLAETIRLLKHVFGALAGREIMDKELISELIRMQARFVA